VDRRCHQDTPVILNGTLNELGLFPGVFRLTFEHHVIWADAEHMGHRGHGRSLRNRIEHRPVGLTSFSDTVYYRAGIENYAHRGYH